MVPRLPKRGTIYLVLAEHSGGLYKIGRTLNLKARVSGLNGASPLPLRLVHSVVVADYTRAERDLHETFCGFRERGEWFRFCDRRVEEVVDEMDAWAAHA